MIYHYCKRPDASLDHDYFLTCSELGERKEVRKKSFRLLLDQLKTPQKLIIVLSKELDIAYRDRLNNSFSSSDSIQQHEIGWKHFIRGRLLKEMINTMSDYY